MITAFEAFDAVRNRKSIDPSMNTEEGLLGILCQYIITYVNNGWLAVNIADKVKGSLPELNKALRRLENLGYTVDKDHVIYWMYGPLV